MHGIADFNSNKGERCIFEKNFYKNLFDYFLNDDLKGMLQYLSNKSKLLNEGLISKEEITYSREMRRSSHNYSIKANQNFIKKAREKSLKKGDKLEYEYNLIDLQNKFYGIVQNIETQKKRKGTISELVEWVFDFKSNSLGKKLLNDLYLGKAQDKDIDQIMELYQDSNIKSDGLFDLY